jgi:hypothetical protein
MCPGKFLNTADASNHNLEAFFSEICKETFKKNFFGAATFNIMTFSRMTLRKAVSEL